jgi:hypothetical protein
LIIRTGFTLDARGGHARFAASGRSRDLGKKDEISEERTKHEDQSGSFEEVQAVKRTNNEASADLD